MNTFKTPKGTVLPLLDLRGKDYLQVAHRVIWFREERPDWSIETEFLQVGPASATAKATVRDPAGRIVATSHKTETRQGFPDFMEKAETGAIGRALALIGYGTQFCADELDEGKRLVDTPAPGKGPQGGKGKAAAPQSKYSKTLGVEVPAGLPHGDYAIPFGKKYKGKTLEQIGAGGVKSYRDFVLADCKKRGVRPSQEAQIFLDASAAWLKSIDSHNGNETFDPENGPTRIG